MISLVGLESSNTLFEVTTVGDFSTKKRHRSTLIMTFLSTTALLLIPLKVIYLEPTFLFLKVTLIFNLFTPKPISSCQPRLKGNHVLNFHSNISLVIQTWFGNYRYTSPLWSWPLGPKPIHVFCGLLCGSILHVPRFHDKKITNTSYTLEPILFLTMVTFVQQNQPIFHSGQPYTQFHDKTIL